MVTRLPTRPNAPMISPQHAVVEELETTRFSDRQSAQKQAAEGFWLVTREGAKHWIPYMPRMPLDYYPVQAQGQPEEIRFVRIDDKEVTIRGYRLEPVLEDIARRRGHPLQEHTHPRDVKSTAPYIERITVRDLRFHGDVPSPCEGER